MINYELLYQLFSKSTGVYTDTRKPLKGGIFLSLKGPSFNGNEYALKAIKQGACLAIIDDYSLIKKSDKLFYVKNTYNTLKFLANQHRKKLKCPVLAITGSNGKTTTKELIKSVFQKEFKTYATIGNLNNHIGVPLTILNTPLSAEFLIIEMGANHLNEIKELCLIAEPTHGYITNFGKAHIEGFGSEEAIIRGKSELYNYLYNSKGKIFVNIENKNQIKELIEKPFISFGPNKKSDHKISYLNSKRKLKLNFKGLDFVSTLYGEYNLPNIAAAIIIGNYFNIPLEKIQLGIKNYVSNNNRSQLIKLKKYNIVLDAYNANPSSMSIAIKCFHDIYPCESILILGDMLELGKYSKQGHEEIITLAKSLSFNRIITVGENFKKTSMNISNPDKFSSTYDLIDHIKKSPIKHKNIFIKGSRSFSLEKILDFI